MTTAEVSVIHRKRQHFKLDRATLCLDCEEVFEIEGTCPACGSLSIFSVARFLNRPDGWKP